MIVVQFIHKYAYSIYCWCVESKEVILFALVVQLRYTFSINSFTCSVYSSINTLHKCANNLACIYLLYYNIIYKLYTYTCLLQLFPFNIPFIIVRRRESTKPSLVDLVWFIFRLRPCQHDDGYINDRSQIKVHTDEQTQDHSARSSLTVTHPSTNRGRRWLPSVTCHWAIIRHSKPFSSRASCVKRSAK